MNWLQATYPLTTDDRVLQKTPISFDVSVGELFWTLTTGATLILAEPGGHRDPVYLVEIINREKITLLNFVPSMLQAFLEFDDARTCRTVRRVICIGEALPMELQEKFFSSLDSELNNLYGPTEAAVTVSYWNCERRTRKKIVPIGKPMANVQLYVLDSSMQPVPAGVAGELFIGGKALARGYWNREELTKKRFIRNPFSTDPHANLYVTGDIAKFLPDGNIEYLGRVDNQVKIRGFRIELGEIEAALAALPSVSEAVVCVHEGSTREKRLVAFLVSKQNSSEAEGDRRAALLRTLPEYMIPSVFIEVSHIPLSSNGKIDRKALLESPEFNSAAGGAVGEQVYVAPVSDKAQLLASIWQDVLGLSRVGINDDYYSAGGDSLRAIQIVIAAKRVGLNFRPQDLGKHGTIARLISHILTQSRVERGTEIATLDLLSSAADSFSTDDSTCEDVYPVTNMQKVMIEHFLSNSERNGVYHFQKLLRIDDESLSITHLAKTLELLVAKHPVFRTTFFRNNRGDLFQKVLREIDFIKSGVFTEIDLRGVSERDKYARVGSLVQQDRQRGFEIGRDGELPYRFVVVSSSINAPRHLRRLG
jgi:hypothetical protein